MPFTPNMVSARKVARLVCAAAIAQEMAATNPAKDGASGSGQGAGNAPGHVGKVVHVTESSNKELFDMMRKMNEEHGGFYMGKDYKSPEEWRRMYAQQDAKKQKKQGGSK